MSETLDLLPRRDELLAVFDGKYRREPTLGWGPRTRLSFDYFNPDDYYEAIVARLVGPDTRWADIGCGRDIFPSNPALAQTLARRAEFVFGIDPDPNIRENRFISEGFEGMVEDCRTPHRFDLITLRMVAEHIVDPDAAVAKLAELTRPGGLVVIYTPNRWSPVSIIAALVPNRFHYAIKRLFWGGEEKDTFPTAFRLNTRRTIARHCRNHGLDEVFFAKLDDCRTFSGFRWLSYVELGMQRLLRAVGLHYPENCLLGVYRRT